MKKLPLLTTLTITIALSIILLTASQTPPTLVTKSFLDNLIFSKFNPIQQQLSSIDSQLKDVEKRLNAAKAKLSLKVSVTIDSRTAYVNNEAKTLDVAPRIEKGRTYVPVRFIGEAFGAQFDWDEKNQKVTYIIGRNYIELFIGKETAYVNRSAVSLDAPPIIYEGRTLVPFRFMGQSIGAQVEWNDQTRTATIIK
ncbi:MAG: copper amine oxidase N-terminal domain-containing protein [Clostridia bacterium]|nr:copper amine oxidase N-terminal domain-containing protein [Clostridia bacterium]